MNKRQKKKHGLLYSQRMNRELAEINVLLDQAMVRAEKMKAEQDSLRLRAHQAEARLSNLRNPWFVRLECERGLNDPLLGLTIQIHPEEFREFLRYSPMVRTSPTPYSYDVGYWASYAADLVRKALMDYISHQR